MITKKNTLLLAIFAQWFSRGYLLKICMGMENWKVLLVAFGITLVISPPIQGHMSDKVARKKVILFGQVCLLTSISLALLAVFRGPDTLKPTLAFVSALALNGCLGNASPGCTALIANSGVSFRDSAIYMLMTRNIGILSAFILPFTFIHMGLAAFILNLVAMLLVVTNISMAESYQSKACRQSRLTSKGS